MYEFFVITLRSHDRAKAAPIPAAGPLIEAITGGLKFTIFSNMGL